MDLANILNEGGAGAAEAANASAAAAPPASVHPSSSPTNTLAHRPQGRSMSTTYPHDPYHHHQSHVPRPNRSYSSISEISPSSHHGDMLRSPLAPSSAYASPEMQRELLPLHTQATAPYHNSPTLDLQRDVFSSLTPTTARSSPGFPREILNPAGPVPTPPVLHSSPVDRNSSMLPRGSLPFGDVRQRPAPAAMGPPPEQHRASPDTQASLKRKADTALESEPLQKPRMKGPPSMTANGQPKPIPQSIPERSQHRSVPQLLSIETPDPIRGSPKFPSPAPRRQPLGSSDGTRTLPTSQPPAAKPRPTEIPIWARQGDRGRRRLVMDVSGPMGGAQRASSQGPPNPNGHKARSNTPDTHIGDRTLTTMEPNLTGFPTYSNLNRQVSHFLWENVIAHPAFDSDGPAKASWEIEAKLGTILDRETRQRFANGSTTECLLHESINKSISFQADLSQAQYKTLNMFLNDELKRSMAPGRARIGYHHPRELDTFYKLNRAGVKHIPESARKFLNPNHEHKIRVTRDAKTKQVTNQIVKARVSDIHVFCPQNLFDIRISVSLEIKFDGDVEEFADPDAETNERNKDRLSYSHQATQVDLTQVRTPTGLTHEAEIELDVARLREEAAKIGMAESDKYEELVASLLDNAVVLNRAAEATAVPGTGPSAAAR